MAGLTDCAGPAAAGSPLADGGGKPLVATPGLHLSKDIADYPDGIVLVIDKPWRWTSADVIRKVKYAAIRHFGKKNLKVGHAGTLDPLADGVLLVCIGAATKKAEEYQRHDKEYLTDIVFGATTPSYDLEKEPDERFATDGITAKSVAAALEGFKGEQMQVAPLFSAKNIDGVRAYELARKALRKGEAVDDSLIRSSCIVISRLDLLDFGPYEPVTAGAPADAVPAPEAAASATPIHASAATTTPAPEAAKKNPLRDASSRLHDASARIHVADTADLHGCPRATLRIRCSKGTYIRALARDLGETLGSGAFISRLRRTASGDFTLKAALTLDQALALFE